MLVALCATLTYPAIADEKKPHVVLVCGTLHYSPELTMPVFAKELERFGFRTTVVMGKGDPEKKTEDVLPGIAGKASKDHLSSTNPRPVSVEEYTGLLREAL